ncbi:MAG TPA: carboxypeptidase-like regulatory domain-containing protein [Terracidiphilus sp.]|nr:carboxypeptidase-like regulatory domain-containing protein [Terracidiphilus sp.]
MTTGSILFAQSGATGTILGTVTDSTGAVVPNAKVIVTNVATGVNFQTVSSSAGDYQAPALNPGTYKVSATAEGFQKSVTTSFVLAVDQSLRVNMVMKPGAVTQTVEVSAQSVELDTENAAISQLVSQQQVAELPLDGRNFVQLLFISAGAVTIGGEQGTMRQGEGDAISINGGRPEGNNFTLDGLTNTDTAMETPAVILSQDAIQEFKVESGVYPAEYGFSAGQVNIVSKSGTNSLHGSIFESNRSYEFDAKPFPTATTYEASTPTSNSVLELNQFGFVAGGPVYFPKLYNGRNKSFWMANYEGWRMNNGGQLRESEPNPPTLTGNFAAETYPALPTQTVNGASVALPGGTLPDYGTPQCTALLSLGYNCMPVNPATGQDFPSDQITPALITSHIGEVATSNPYWGTPTVLNQPEGVTNFIYNVPGPLHQNQYTFRGDQDLGKLGKVFGRYTHSNYVNSTNYNSGSPTLGLQEYFEQGISWEVSHTINIGANSVNNFRFGYLSANAPQGSSAPPSSVISSLDESNVFTHFGPLQETWPNVNIGNSAGIYASGGGPVNSYTGSSSPQWEFADSFTKVHGRHTFGFGVDYRYWTLTRNLDDDFFGDWSFSSSTITNNNGTIPAGLPNAGESSCPNAPVSVNGAAAVPLCGTGNSVADMLLGYYSGWGGFAPGPLSPTTQAGNPQDHVYHYVGPYAEDDWKITPKLSINYGLRWDFRAATYEIDNHFFWLDTTNTQGGLCYADPTLSKDGVAPGVGYNGGPILRYCGSVPRPAPKTPFAPRFGFNYRLDNRTVVRGGYGIFFSSYEGREIDDSADIYPYSIRLSLSPTTVSNPAADPKLGNQLLPAYGSLGPFPVSTLSFIAVIESENPLDPYVQTWTLSVEREMARNTTLEVNYIGNHGTHLLDRRDIAQPNPIPSSSLAFCQQQNSAGTYVNIDTAPCTVSSRLPYPNFNGFYIDSDFHGYSHYEAGNVKLEHRASDLALTSVFTWAKSLDDKSSTAGAGASGTGYQGFMNNHDPVLDYGPSDFDTPYRFVTSYVYQLPFGRGKKFASQANRVADLAIGNWQLTGIATFQKGFPYSVAASDIDGINGSTAPRANYTPGCKIHSNQYSGSLAQFSRLNLSCFTQPALGVYGDTARNWLTQPGINNWDMSIGKGFSLGEGARFMFKADAFNTFNHHQYAGDVNGLLVAGSGGNEEVSNTVGSATGGLITGASSPRIIQLGGKITF